jgi:uncharacterized protein (TIGR02246 family)
MLATEISDTITKLTEAFNDYDFDRIMTFFTDDAVYVAGDGKTYRGKKEIRAAFQGHFNGEFGDIRFDTHDRIIDAENRRAASPWVCRHDISHSKPGGIASALRAATVRLVIGNKFGWEGVDLFHFDANGKITGKFTYGWFESRPHLERALG